MNALASFADGTARLSGKIKWFNLSKGYGFITPDDGTVDVFLPRSVLERSGFEQALEGASVTFEWAEGPKGRIATQVLDLDASTATGRRAHNQFSSPGAGGEASSVLLNGIVKWYDPVRGFGFILPDDGSKDVFVHVTALHRAGIDELERGQAVRITVAHARRGRETASLELLPGSD